jgi:diacylglycerol kinase
MARRWRDKFREAFEGIVVGIRGQSSCIVHAIMTVAVIGLGLALECQLWEWCVLLGCTGAVWTAELFNSAIEMLFRGLPQDARDQVYPCLHVAAGAVLVASIFSAVIGLLIFCPKLFHIVERWPK